MLHIKTAQGWRPWLPSYRVCENSNDLQGCFQNHDPEVVRDFLTARTNRFCALMAEGQANHWHEPLFGAFGEKL